ncbi:hypothetical protein ABZ793_33055 [Micromonospora sp. NPDC047465]|uniref:hypothetical protein n=1 Tax=Micromonospora sp. NPDC047465 TaxID=3154813 RepID=UPI00340107CC
MDDDLTPPPALLALLDQDRAVLVDLVAAAAEHTDAEACPHPGLCPGDQVTDALEVTDPDDRDRLLRLAIAELARLGYTRPPRYRLTGAAYVALNQHPPARWPFGGRHA